MKATGTLFSNLLQGQQHFVVPLFQRPYTWGEGDWRTLFDDVVEVYEEGIEESHFVGSIVTKSLGATPEGVSPFLIIDGQQRLTTVTLLLAALRDVAAESAPMLSDKIHRLYLTNEFAPDKHRYKVLPTQADRAAYQTIVDRPSGNGGMPEVAEAPLPRLAYEYFVKRLRDHRIDDEPLDPVQLEQVLVGRLEVVSITLEDADNEYRIFESLNGTGTPLAQADLLRNYFFMRLPIEEHEDLYHGVWLPMQESLGGSLDIFFRHAYMSDGQFVREADVYRAWKTRLDSVSSYELGDHMRHLASEAKNYHKLLVPAEEPDAPVSRRLSRLKRWGGQTTYPFLLNAYRLYESGEIYSPEFAEILAIIESFLVRRMFARVYAGQLNRLFLRLYHQLPEGTSLAERTRAVLSEPSRRWPRDNAFREAVQQVSFYTEGRADQRRLILETIEEDFGTKEPIDFSKLTIEHVMPQTLTRDWVSALGEFAEERHRETVHRIGNLTLTGYNPELSNSPFQIKRKKLAESNVEMNKEIAREEEWGFAQIDERGRHLAELAIKIWPGPADAGDASRTASIATPPSERTEDTQKIHIPDVQAELQSVISSLINEEHEVELDASYKSKIRFGIPSWDTPALLSAKGWTSSRRALLFEFWNDPRRLELRLYIGPAPDEIRTKILDMAHAHPDVFSVPRRIGTKWTTIFTRRYLSEEDYEDVTEVAREKQIRHHWNKFLDDDLPRIDAVLREEEWAGPAQGTRPRSEQVEKTRQNAAISVAGDVGQPIQSILPKTANRKLCLEAFADAIVEANLHGRDKWAVTHKGAKVRLIVGHLVLLTLMDRPEHGPMWMAVDKELLATSNHKLILDQSADWEWDNKQHPEYPTIYSRNGYYRPSESHAETWPVVGRLHFESIRRAADQTTMDRRTPGKHTPAILQYLRNELGRDIPDPRY